MHRLVLWSGTDAWRTEATQLELGAGGLQAHGTQIGAAPLPYVLRYALLTDPDLLTRRFEVQVDGEGWRRSLVLAHDGDGSWECVGSLEGEPIDLPAPGGDPQTFGGATDCDLGLSPLTNLMPILRGGLHEHPGALEILAAWVAVPELSVHASRQRYEHVSRDDDGAVVRYVDLGLHEGFQAELDVDRDGVVRHYPDLAKRV